MLALQAKAFFGLDMIALKNELGNVCITNSIEWYIKRGDTGLFLDYFRSTGQFYRLIISAVCTASNIYFLEYRLSKIKFKLYLHTGKF